MSEAFAYEVIVEVVDGDVVNGFEFGGSLYGRDSSPHVVPSRFWSLARACFSSVLERAGNLSEDFFEEVGHWRQVSIYYLCDK